MDDEHVIGLAAPVGQCEAIVGRDGVDAPIKVSAIVAGHETWRIT